MPVCSYLVVPERGAAASLTRRLATLPGCDVAPADRGEVLLLVTDTPGPREEAALRQTLEEMEGLATLILTFGQIEPTEETDP